MEAFYILLFAAIAAATVFLELGKSKGGGSSSSATALTRDFLAFRNNYVLVYALMMGELVFVLKSLDCCRIEHFDRLIWFINAERGR